MIIKSIAGFKRAHYRVLLIDPPWRFETWNKSTVIPRGRRGAGTNVAADVHYRTMEFDEIVNLPVGEMAANDCVLFLWGVWPLMPEAFRMIGYWGFTYKTCAFNWIKVTQGNDPAMGQGFWTRANSEVCLLATRGKPKRLRADVRQGIIEPRREHSRKPDTVRHRIERLVSGPRADLFSRQDRKGWHCWGDQIDKFPVDTTKSRK